MNTQDNIPNIHSHSSQENHGPEAVLNTSTKDTHNSSNLHEEKRRNFGEILDDQHNTSANNHTKTTTPDQEDSSSIAKNKDDNSKLENENTHNTSENIGLKQEVSDKEKIAPSIQFDNKENSIEQNEDNKVDSNIINLTEQKALAQQTNDTTTPADNKDLNQINSSPLAGSLTTSNEDVSQDDAMTPLSANFVTTPSSTSNNGGKILPSNGKKTSESLLFYTTNENNSTVEGKNGSGNEFETAHVNKMTSASKNFMNNNSEIIDSTTNKTSFNERLNSAENGQLQVLSSTNISANLGATSLGTPQAQSDTSLTPSILNTNPLTLNNLSLSATDTSKLSSAKSEVIPSYDIDAPMGSQTWNNQVSSRIRWLGKMDISSAEIQLHPAELGSMEIKITSENDQTRISFISNNAATRDIIEAALPRLKELLSESGLQLEQSDVSAQSHENDNNGENQSGQTTQHNNLKANDLQTGELASARVTNSQLGQIDHYV